MTLQEKANEFTEVIGTLDYPSDHSCFSAPKVHNEVQRTEAIRNLNYLADNVTRVIFVVGEQGIGKTTLLNQYRNEHKDKTISLFLSPGSSYSTDESALKIDLASQIASLTDDSLSNEINSENWTRTLHNLNLFLKRKRISIKVIIDGLNSIDENKDIEKIITLLPFHLENLTFIISFNEEKIEKFKIFERLKIKTYHVPLFTIIEAKHLTKIDDEKSLTDILNVFTPTPKTLLCIKGILDNGVSIDKILDSHQVESRDLIDIEWQANDKKIKNCYKAIALISENPFKTSRSDILAIPEYGTEELEKLESISFINNEKNEGQIYYEFRSKLFKKYSREKLKITIIELSDQIEKIINNKKTDIENLPRIIQHSRNKEDWTTIVTETNNDNILNLFNKTKSITRPSFMVEQALLAATSRNNNLEKIKFSQLLCMLRNATKVSSLRSEVEYYISNSEFSNAYYLADSADSVEEKVILLSKIASEQKLRSGSPEEEYIEKIKSLINSIDFQQLDIEILSEISANLFPILPSHGLELMRKVDDGGRNGSNKVDFIYARLCLEAIKNNTEFNEFDSDDFKVATQLKDSMKSLKKIGNIFEIDRIKKDFNLMGIPKEDMIIILNNVLTQVEDYDKLLDVALFCIDLIIDTEDYSSNATIFKEISKTISNRTSCEKSKIIYDKTIAQLVRLSQTGPSIDYIFTSLNLASFEVKNKIASERHKSVLSHIKTKLSDTSVSLRAVLALENFYRKNNNNGHLGELMQFKSNLLDELFNESANQIVVIKESLSEQAKIDLNIATAWINRINTSDRKCYARALAVKGYLRNEDFSIARAIEEINRIILPQVYTKAVNNLINKVSELDTLSHGDFERLRKMKNKIKNFGSKIIFISKVYEIGTRSNVSQEKLSNLFNEIVESLENIDSEWSYIEYGFNAAKIISKSSKENAKRIFDKVKEKRSSADFYNENIQSQYASSIDLAIRTNNILLENGICKTDNINKILSNLSSIPSNSQLSKLYSKLTSSLQLNQQPIRATDIIQTKLIPLIDNLSSERCREYDVCFYFSSPAIFQYDINTFRKYYALLDDVFVKGDVLTQTVNYIFEKVMLFEPYYHKETNYYTINIKDVNSIISLIMLAERDWLVYSLMRKLVFALKNAYKKNDFTETQKADIYSSLLKVLDKLPMSGCIKHDGYKILCEALLCVLSNEKDKSIWNTLFDRTSRIPNASDSIFTASVLLQLDTFSPITQRKKLFEEIVDKMSSVNFISEKLDLAESISERNSDLCKSTTRRLLMSTLQASVEDNPQKFQQNRRALVDACYEFDQNLASSIANLLDSDPAKRKLIEEDFKEKKVSEDFIEQFKTDGSVNITQSQIDEFAKFCSDQLGKINANVAESRKPQLLNKFLENLHLLDFEQIYYVFSFFLESHKKSLRHDKNKLSEFMQTILSNTFENIEIFKSVHKMNGVFEICNSNSEMSIMLSGTNTDYHDSVNFISTHLYSESAESILICEPYFDLDNLQFISECINKDYSIGINILTTTSVYDKLKSNAIAGDADISESISKYWKDNICPDRVPAIEIVFVGVKDDSKKQIIHDRWWISISTNNGVKIGTSISGIGKQVCSIDKLSTPEIVDANNSLRGFFDRNIKEFQGEKLTYKIELID